MRIPFVRLFIGTHPYDRKKIGIIGICGFGGFALNATAIDKRVKAVAVTSMYDMTRVMSKGYNDAVTLEQRTKTLEQLGEQRWKDAEAGTFQSGAILNSEKRRAAICKRIPRLLPYT